MRCSTARISWTAWSKKAFELNRVPGQNVYIGAALRRPGTPVSGRCSDDDFFALTAFYADLDEGVETARSLYRERRCPPTAVVVTGRQPHQRAQPWWRLETPERDPEVCRRQNRALALALGGDPSVVNPGRVLRLAGSIAWPTKPGRTVERTELHTFNDGRPKIYLPGQLAKAFPPFACRAVRCASEFGARRHPEHRQRVRRRHRRGMPRCDPSRRPLARPSRAPDRPLDRPRMVRCRDPDRGRGAHASRLHRRSDPARGRAHDRGRPGEVEHPQSGTSGPRPSRRLCRRWRRTSSSSSTSPCCPAGAGCWKAPCCAAT